MPPKKEKAVEEPVPEVVDEPKRQTFCGFEISDEQAKQIGGIRQDPAKLALRQRACHLSVDRKLRDMQDLMRKGPEPGAWKPPASAPAGLQGLDFLLPPRHGGAPSVGAIRFAREKNSAVHHESVCRSVNRLMSDLVLANDDSLRGASHHLRCGHLDRAHDWFRQHKVKADLPDTRRGPAFLTYTKEDRVMVGSLRAEPNERRYAPEACAKPRQTPAWMEKSASSPALRR